MLQQFFIKLVQILNSTSQLVGAKKSEFQYFWFCFWQMQKKLENLHEGSCKIGWLGIF